MSVKSRTELQKLRAIGKIVRAALDAMASAGDPGVTTAELDRVGAETLARYAAEGASPIKADIDRIEALGVRVITGNFASPITKEDGVVRHAAGRVSGALLALGQTAVARRR